MEAIELAKYNVSSDWMIFVFLFTFFLIAWIINVYPKRFNRLLFSVFNNNRFFQIIREELVFSHRASIVLTIIFIVQAGLFLTISSIIFDFNVFKENTEILVQYGYWCLIIISIYILKWILSGIFLSLIQRQDILKIYLFLTSTFNKTIGLVLIPITISAIYLPLNYASFFIKLGGAIWLIFLIYRLFKALSISFLLKVPRLYIILYLCAFEILPFIVGMKMVIFLSV